MIDLARRYLIGMITGLRVPDLVDMLLVAFFLFVLFTWLRRSMSKSAVRGFWVLLGILGGLSGAARFLDLYLIEQVTTVLLFAVGLAGIVAFQPDLRRMFDRTGTWLFNPRGVRTAPGTPTVDLLVDAVARMAEARTGALIAVRGAEPWDHHVQGGIELEGSVSLPLLLSIFDHNTPGHDGAVLLEGNQVTRFGVHLPLAPAPSHPNHPGGTRHAAARGLSRVCDALVVVVSEERGTVSVARDGVITEMETASGLKEPLGRFWQEHYGSSDRPKGRWWDRHSWTTAALSFAVSVLMWNLFAYSPEIVQRSFDVPIEYRDLPPNWRIQEGDQTARVTLSGPEHAFRLIDPAALAVAFTLAEPVEGENRLTISRENLDVPTSIALDGADPEAVTVKAWPLFPTLLPVHVPTRGSLPDSLELVSLQAEPDSVTVLAPEDHGLSRLSTTPVSLDSVGGTVSMRRSLELPNGTVLPDPSSAEVTVHVTVRTREGGAPASVLTIRSGSRQDQSRESEPEHRLQREE